MQKVKYFIPEWNFVPASWPRVETFIPGWNIFFPYNRNFSFIPWWEQNSIYIYRVEILFKFSTGDETFHIIVKNFNSVNGVEISSHDEKSPYNQPLTMQTKIQIKPKQKLIHVEFVMKCKCTFSLEDPWWPSFIKIAF